MFTVKKSFRLVMDEDSGVPWAWIWFFAAVLAFVIGYLARDDIRKFFEKKKKPVKTPGGEKVEEPLPPKPTPTSDGGSCTFENEDTVLKQVFSYDGKLVKPGTKVSCSECNQYVFKDEDGCVPYGFDRGNKKSGVCTIGTYVKDEVKGVVQRACSSSKDCLNNARCEDGVCLTWMIPDSKVCPF
jgi:hypothetical protein